MNTKFLKLSPSPHIKDIHDVPHLMFGVVIALIPALIVSVIYFGMGALKVTLVSVLACLLFEYLIQKFLLGGAYTLKDGSALITGLLLAFNVPSSLPLWMIIVGSFVAIAVAKMSFGGLGRNPFNPALVGRVFLLISFPVQMTNWPKPSAVDVYTGATPLAILKEGLKQGASVDELFNQMPSYVDMFIGKLGGSLGEVSAVVLLLGGVYMLARRIISWHIPVSFLGTVILFTGILWLVDSSHYINPLFHLLTGGLMLGAIFMATDMATSPMTYKGMLIFGVGCGLLTVIIRVFGAYPEGVSFAILIMNALVPIINNFCRPKFYGVK